MPISRAGLSLQALAQPRQPQLWLADICGGAENPKIIRADEWVDFPSLDVCCRNVLHVVDRYGMFVFQA